MRCPSCHLIIDPRTTWKSSNCFYCSEFCADSEISAPVERCVQKEVLDRQYLEPAAAAFAVFSGLKIEPSESTIRRHAPMTTIVRLRGLFSADEKVNGDSSSSLCCDHCRGKLKLGVHRYWRMRFCSSACMNAYQQRLSTHTQRKIYEIDGYRPSWKAAS